MAKDDWIDLARHHSLLEIFDIGPDVEGLLDIFTGSTECGEPIGHLVSGGSRQR